MSSKTGNNTLNRRQFVAASLGAGAAFSLPLSLSKNDSSAAALPLTASAQSESSLVVSATLEGRCATCVYWGGQRSVNREKTQVRVMSFGTCNNSESPMFGQTTSPEHGPMAFWAKWPALD